MNRHFSNIIITVGWVSCCSNPLIFPSIIMLGVMYMHLDTANHRYAQRWSISSDRL